MLEMETKKMNCTRLQCHICSNLFVNTGNLNKHLKNTHKLLDFIRKDGEKIFQCIECKESFTTKWYMNRHITKKHRKVFSSNESSRQDGKRSLSSKLRSCNEHFQKRKAIKKHNKESINDCSGQDENATQSKNNHFQNICATLPLDYEYHLINSTETNCKFRVNNIATKEEAQKWLEDLKAVEKIDIRKMYVRKPTQRVRTNTKILFKEKYRCHHNTLPKKKTKKPHPKHINCPWKCRIILQMTGTSKSTLVYMNNFHNHGHNVDSIKHRRPSKEVVQEFKRLFEEGLKPVTALAAYTRKLRNEKDYPLILEDHSIVPSISWVRNLYSKKFGALSKKKFGDDGLLDVLNVPIVLEDSVQEFTEHWFEPSKPPNIDLCVCQDEIYNECNTDDIDYSVPVCHEVEQIIESSSAQKAMIDPENLIFTPDCSDDNENNLLKFRSNVEVVIQQAKIDENVMNAVRKFNDSFDVIETDSELVSTLLALGISYNKRKSSTVVDRNKAKHDGKQPINSEVVSGRCFPSEHGYVVENKKEIT